MQTSGMSTPSTGTSLTRRLLMLEVVLVLAVSLGRSGVYALVNLIATWTAPGSLSEQSAVMNGSKAPGREWLDLTYQLMGLAFGLVPAALAAYLLLRDGKDLRRIWYDRTRWRSDTARGAVLAAVVGGTGLAFYLATYAAGVDVTVVAEDLPHVWWRFPVLVLAALQNALLEEIVVLGYVLTQARRPERTAAGRDRAGRRAARQLSPVPGARRVLRQPGDGPAVRLALPPVGADHADGGGPHDPRRGGVRRLRPARRPRVVAADLVLSGEWCDPWRPSAVRCRWRPRVARSAA